MSRKPARRRHRPNGLTPLEDLFIAEYMVDFCAGKALVRAGSGAKYPDQQAYEMLHKPHIAAEIEKRIAARSEKAAINAQWVLNELAILYSATKTAALTPDDRGRRDRAAIREARQTLELMGKHVNVNAFRSQLGIGNPDGSEFDLSGLSDEQLDQLETLLSAIALTGGDTGREGAPDS